MEIFNGNNRNNKFGNSYSSEYDFNDIKINNHQINVSFIIID